MKRNVKSAFTLVEMLIVVVIIGLLASVMIGKYQSFIQSARDTNRTTALIKVGQSLESYRSDWGTRFPMYSGCMTNDSNNPLYKSLVTEGGYIEKLPTDPTADRLLYLYTGSSADSDYCQGEFFYSKLTVSSIDGYGYLIVANTETPKSMNILTGDDSGLVLSEDPAGDGEALRTYETQKCTQVVFTGGTSDYCELGQNQGAILKGQENQNGWYMVSAGG